MNARDLLELSVLTAVLAQDAFWLMDQIGDRTMDKLLLRWHQLADELGWPCRYCGARNVGPGTCEWRDLYN